MYINNYIINLLNKEDKMKHYVYRITNTKLNKHYYGTRTSKNKTPEEDIGYIYFSSSSDKAFINDQKENPQNYRYKIIRKFYTRKEAIKLEIKLHNKFNVGINESFYNRSKQTSTKWDTTGLIQSEEAKLKISSASKKLKHQQSKKFKEAMSKRFKGKKLSEDHISKRQKSRGKYASGKEHHNYNTIPSEETRLKISVSNKGKKRSEEVKSDISRRMQGIGNNNAYIYTIYNDKNEIVYIFETNLLNELKKLSIPVKIFQDSIKNNNKIEYKKGMAKKSLPYIGWYGIKKRKTNLK